MIIRSLLLLLPLSLWAWYVIQPSRTSREITASFLGFVWAFLIALMLNSALVSHAAIHFTVNDNLFYGVPLDWVFAQAAITGALVPLARSWIGSIWIRILIQISMVTLTCSLSYIDYKTVSIILMVLLHITLVAIPAMLLADWTAIDTNIGKRAILQSLAWTVLLFWFFPSVIFHLAAGNWNAFITRAPLLTGLYLLPLLLPAYLLISALYQFAIEGSGTAFPYDPPKRLVTKGVYQYISNPMQAGISLAVGWWGVVIQSTWVSVSAIIAVILFVVFKDVCNGSCAIGKNNSEWEEYQNKVPKWFPNLK